LFKDHVVFIQLTVVGLHGRRGLRVNKQQVKNVNVEREHVHNQRHNLMGNCVMDQILKSNNAKVKNQIC